MPNMGYVRFENTLSDLLDCLNHINDDVTDKSESQARKRLVEVCQQIVDEYQGEEEEEEEEN